MFSQDFSRFLDIDRTLPKNLRLYIIRTQMYRIIFFHQPKSLQIYIFHQQQTSQREVTDPVLAELYRDSHCVITVPW